MRFLSSLYSILRKIWSLFSERYLNQPFIRFTALTIILIGLLNLIIIFCTSSGGMNIYGTWAGGDYPCFYVAGKMLRDYPPDKLYDFRLHAQILHSLLPNISLTEEMPYMNSPFFALLFEPLSLMPYMNSFFVWTVFSVILYSWGFILFWKSLDSMPPKSFKIVFLLALSFEPFLIEVILGGNTSAVGFFAFALFFYFEYQRKDLISGMTLGVLLYKPTFLILILPMLLIARRKRILAGFGISSMVIALLSVLTVGYDACIKYVDFLLGVSTKTLGTEEIFRTWKYVDIFSFCRLLFGTISLPVLILIAAVSLFPIIYSIKLWWKIDSMNKSGMELLKGSVITLTCIFNLHFGIYDTVILVPSVLL